MKIDILDDKEEAENQNADVNGGNDSAARDGTGMSAHPNSVVLNFVRNIGRRLGMIRFYIWPSRRAENDENGATLAKDNQKDEKTHAEKEDGRIAHKQKKPIVMSIWVWQEVLKSITRMEMAERVSLVCHFLKKLCWPRLHGNKVTPHIVKELRFDEEKEENGKTKAILRIGSWMNYKHIPIATQCPAPEYIQGFEMIGIGYMNADVLKFVRNASPRLVNIRVQLCLRHRKMNTIYHTLRGLFNALNGSVSSLDLSTGAITVSQLHKEFPGLMENILALYLPCLNKKDCIELNKLISAKLANGKPFVIHFIGPSCDDVYSIMIDNIRKVFQVAKQPQSIMIELSSYEQQRTLALDVFRLENEQTGEVLRLEHHARSTYKLYRCPRGGIQRWTEEAIKAVRGATHVFCSF